MNKHDKENKEIVDLLKEIRGTGFFILLILSLWLVVTILIGIS